MQNVLAQHGSPRRLIDLQKVSLRPLQGRLLRFIKTTAEQLLSIRDVNETYAHIPACSDILQFCSACLCALDIHLNVEEKDIEKIPAQGPLIALANHPFGGLDGIILAGMLLRRRKDVKILGNYLLRRIPEIRDSIIPVDPFKTVGAISSNRRFLREALDWLKEGGALCLFPAGEVSHISFTQWRVADAAWTRHTGPLIRRTGASVLPVYFSGRNSAFFQIMGLLHPGLRTILLPREIIKKRSSSISVRIGSPIPFARLADFTSDEGMVQYLRLRTHIMKKRFSHSGVYRLPIVPKGKKRIRFPLVQPPSGGGAVNGEIAALPDSALLVRQGNLSVYVAQAGCIPHILQEIGLLREKTFRETGEGTGRECDLDAFDRTYLQLFLWNDKEREIAGGYRLGCTDKIIPRQGDAGLYVTTLFKIRPGFLEGLGPALELGRSFVSARYQKKYSSLLLLWRGIGEFIVRYPQYRILFGPVSISNEYHTISKNLIMRFLIEQRCDNGMARSIQPRSRVFRGMRPSVGVKALREIPNIEHVSALVSEIENDGKGVPVLLRQYLKMNGTILCFNRDKKFSNAIDGFLMVDLLKTDRRLLERFMTGSGAAGFLKYHAASPESAAEQMRTAAGL